MFRKQPIKNSSQSCWNVESLPDFLVELDAQSQELISGGSFAGNGKIRVRLTPPDVLPNQHPAIYGIRSIPTLM